LAVPQRCEPERVEERPSPRIEVPDGKLEQLDPSIPCPVQHAGGEKAASTLATGLVQHTDLIEFDPPRRLRERVLRTLAKDSQDISDGLVVLVDAHPCLGLWLTRSEWLEHPKEGRFDERTARLVEAIRKRIVVKRLDDVIQSSNFRRVSTVGFSDNER
jgi:hypothetical protein